MRLIRLSANRDTFKTINFNASGLTLIVGSKTKGGETYNGVGKSLIVALLHFCLGANKNDEFSSKIPQWEFTLEFELAGQRHSISRNTSNQGVFLLDNQSINQAAFNNWMEERLFFIPEGVKKLTFRSLLPKFMRRGSKEYVDPLNTSDRSDYDILIRNAFLLGLDVDLIAKKAILRDEIVRIKNLRENFKNDTLLKDFYSGGKDTEIHLNHLEHQIRELERAKEKFVVAENYHELQKAADQIATEIDNNKNTLFLIGHAIENINKSIKEQPDIALERLQSLYGELTHAFKPESLKRLDELDGFHKRMLENRIARLSQEKLRLIDQQKAIEATLKKKQSELDKQLHILGQTGALDQYTAMVNQIATLSSQAEKLRDYQTIEREYSNKEADLKGQLNDEVIKSNNYLEETHEFRDRHTGIFKKFVDRFYPGKIAGISIQNNDGDNKIRFDLDVHVENDSSDGINEVRIFCYDMTLLTLRQGHKVGFVFHDSRLFANMDVRQRAMLFRVANECAVTLGIQYVATLNPDFISGMVAEFSTEEMQSLIKNNIVLELKDDSNAGKLLGIQVDMHYDR